MAWSNPQIKTLLVLKQKQKREQDPNAPTLSIVAIFQIPLAGPSCICHDLAMEA